jgi:hypothetical protein
MTTLYELLSDLGGTPEEVARTLEHKGIKGTPRNCHDCPVANYLRGTLQYHGEPVVVLPYVVRVGYPIEQTAYMPHAVSNFINQFDKDLYPTLKK